jgi:hypothetical protein
MPHEEHPGIRFRKVQSTLHPRAQQITRSRSAQPVYDKLGPWVGVGDELADAFIGKMDERKRSAIMRALLGSDNSFEFDPSKTPSSSTDPIDVDIGRLGTDANKSLGPWTELPTPAHLIDPTVGWDASGLKETDPSMINALTDDKQRSFRMATPSTDEPRSSTEAAARMKNALIGVPPSIEAREANLPTRRLSDPSEEVQAAFISQEIEHANRHSPEARLKRLQELPENLHDHPLFVKLTEQIIATQHKEQALQAQSDTDRAYAAQLLEEEREFVLLTASNLAESETAKAMVRGSGETFGKNPVWLKDENGVDVLAVVGDQGSFRILNIPADLTPNRVITGEKEISKGTAERMNERITKGVAASLAIPVLNRSLELLNTLKTGGYNKVRYKIQSVFGVEGANEAELSNALGKSVLSQLKSIFGAAFSEAEASKLESMEAGIGKSTDGNISIIKNALKLAESHYQRGLSDAFEVGDRSTHTSMQDNYSLIYEGGGFGPANLEAGATDEEPITEADIAQTMRDTGMSREEVMERLRAQGRI